MDWHYQTCIDCHLDAFHVRGNDQGRQQLVCANPSCKAVLLDNQPALPTPAAPAPKWSPF